MGLPPSLILLWAHSSCSPAARAFGLGVRCCCLAQGDCPAAASAGCVVVAVVSLQFPYFPCDGSQGWRPALSCCAGAVLVFVRSLARLLPRSRSLTAKRKPAETSPSWPSPAERKEMDSPVLISISTEDLSLSLMPFSPAPQLGLAPRKAQGGRRTIPCSLCVEASLLRG